MPNTQDTTLPEVLANEVIGDLAKEDPNAAVALAERTNTIATQKGEKQKGLERIKEDIVKQLQSSPREEAKENSRAIDDVLAEFGSGIPLDDTPANALSRLATALSAPSLEELQDKVPDAVNAFSVLVDKNTEAREQDLEQLTNKQKEFQFLDILPLIVQGAGQLLTVFNPRVGAALTASGRTFGEVIGAIKNPELASAISNFTNKEQDRDVLTKATSEVIAEETLRQADFDRTKKLEELRRFGGATDRLVTTALRIAELNAKSTLTKAEEAEKVRLTTESQKDLLALNQDLTKEKIFITQAWELDKEDRAWRAGLLQQTLDQNFTSKEADLQRQFQRDMVEIENLQEQELQKRELESKERQAGVDPKSLAEENAIAEQLLMGLLADAKIETIGQLHAQVARQTLELNANGTVVQQEVMVKVIERLKQSNPELLEGDTDDLSTLRALGETKAAEQIEEKDKAGALQDLLNVVRPGGVMGAPVIDAINKYYTGAQRALGVQNEGAGAKALKFKGGNKKADKAEEESRKNQKANNKSLGDVIRGR